MICLEEEFEMLQLLSEVSRYASFGEAVFDIYVYEKIYWALLMKIFPQYEEKKILPYCLRQDGSIVDSYVKGIVCNNFEEEVMRYSITGSATTDIVFRYYDKSVYWNKYERVAGYDDDEWKELTEEEDTFSKMKVIFPYQEEAEGCFFERGCVDIMEALNMLPTQYFYFKNRYACDDMLVLKSYLLPYYFRYLKETEKGGNENRSDEDVLYISQIEKALSILQDPYKTGSNSVLEPQLEAGYYVYFDGSTDEFYGSGILKLNKAVILAGKVIDDCILELDKRHHFLPDKVRKGGVNGR